MIVVNRAVFLDRDGTITKSVHILTKIEEIELEEKAAEGIAFLKKSNFKIIVVTNQPQVARGMCTEDDVKRINRKMARDLEELGVVLDGIYFCPHHPEMHEDVPEYALKYRVECECRKPNIGMLKKAGEVFGVDLSKSFVIGDRTVDVQTGKNAGCKTVLVKTGAGGNDKKYDSAPDFVCENLLDAAKIIVRDSTKAVILVGGKGERLWPLTKDIPKPMIKIGGKPVLEHQIMHLKKHGITDIIVCGSYLVEKIKDYFGDGDNFGVRIRYPYEPEPLGSGGAVRNAADFLDCENFVVLSGDVMNDMNIGAALDQHILKEAIATAIVRETDHPQDSDIVVMDNENRIIKYIGRGQESHKTANSGIMIFNRKIIDKIPDGISNMEKDVMFKIIDNEKVYGYISKDYIKDIGTFDRLEAARKHFEVAT